MRRLLFLPLAGASLTLLVFLWPADDSLDQPGEVDDHAAASKRHTGRRAELHRLIHHLPVVAPVAAAALSADFHGVIQDSVSGETLPDADVDWGMAKDGECEDVGVDWSTAAITEDGAFTIPRAEVKGDGELCLSVDLGSHVERTFTAAQATWPAGRPGRTVRLDRLGEIRGRVLSKSGVPATDKDVYVVADGERESEQEATTNAKGWYELDELAPGRYIVYADSSFTHLVSYAEVRLKAGQQLRQDLQEREVKSVPMTAKVVDRSGRPVARVAVSIKPRGKARNSKERYFLTQVQGTTTDRDGAFEADLGRAGWYRVRLHAEDNEEQVMGQADVWAGAGQQGEPTIVYQGKVVVCTLHDAAGRQLLQDGDYSMSITRGCTASMGFALLSVGDRPRYKDLRFPWPPRARSVHVTLNGDGVSGNVTISSPGDVCMVQAQ